MIKNNNIAYIIIILILTAASCDHNSSSYPNYKKINGKYIKRYLKNIEKIDIGRSYFHKEYGIIKYENNFWRDQSNGIIYELGQR